MYDGKDQPQWMLTADRQFSVRSLYHSLVKIDVGFPHKYLWKIKIPAKIKMFLWLIARKSVATKENLIKKGWKEKQGCVYCGQNETIDHLFFTCSAAKLLWSLIKCSFNLKTSPRG